ncbi:MAG: regulatory protein RecX [Muribaculaceae bacterium]
MPSKNPLTPEQAFNRLAALCARSEQAPAACLKKLSAWGVAAPQAEQVMQKLVEQDFVNEQRYARAYTNDRMRFSSWGRLKIAQGLRLGGISHQAIDDALSEIDEQLYGQILQKLIAGKAPQHAGKPYINAKASLMRFGMSHGFEAHLVEHEVDRALAGVATDNELWT